MAFDRPLGSEDWAGSASTGDRGTNSLALGDGEVPCAVLNRASERKHLLKIDKHSKHENNKSSSSRKRSLHGVPWLSLDTTATCSGVMVDTRLRHQRRRQSRAQRDISF
jgi:hypothetical protein